MEIVTETKKTSNPDMVVAIREILDSGEESQVTLAKKVGISDAVLNQWIQNKYVGSIPKTEEKIQKYLESRVKRSSIAAAISVGGFIETHTSQRVIETLGFAQAANDFAVICGGAGMGKTTSARWYATENSNVWLVTITPACATKRPCLSEICAGVGIAESGIDNRMMSGLKKKLAGTNGLLILDEAQHLNMVALETIRSLHDATEIGVALMGNQSIYARLTGGKRQAEFAQLFSRIGKRTILKAPTKRDVEAICEAFGIDDKETIDLARAIADKPGALRSVVKTIRYARMLTPEGSAISQNLLLAAYKNLSDSTGE